MRKLIPTALLACALAAASAPAQGASRITVNGAGFGHGIGLSQYGAYGFARRDTGYEEILAHYYRGTELSSAEDRPVRVLLSSSQGSVSMSGAASANGRELDSRVTYTAKKAGLSRVKLVGKGKTVDTFSAPLRIDSGDGVLNVPGRGRYRGAIEAAPATFGGISVVNSLSLDDYVKGVVPGEMPTSWSLEALKSQAVVARSYALATDRGGPLFDQYPDTRSQVYKGASAEVASTNRAVEETAGQILRYDGKPAVTYYFSTSGGKTENVENVFYGGKPAPYLTSVDDPYDSGSPRHRWKFTYTRSSLGAKLGGWVKGSFREVKVVKRGRSPRIVSADVVGSRGKTRVTGADLKARLGWYDTWATFNAVSSRSAKPAASASWLGALLRRPGITGSVSPRPKNGAIVI
nr:SpoIID/LytB domain-containing protein [Thermoleophilaceae bacterium]